MLALTKKQYKKVLTELLLNIYEMDMKVWIDFKNERLYTLVKDRVHYMDAALHRVLKEDFVLLPLSELKIANAVILENKHYVEINYGLEEDWILPSAEEAVCALIPGVSVGNYLSVSRKNNKYSFGLPGGKVEDTETLIQALEREVLEETGYTLKKSSIKHVFTDNVDGFKTFTYYAEIEQSIPRRVVTETGVVSWRSIKELCSQSAFNAYNIALFKALDMLPEQV